MKFFKKKYFGFFVRTTVFGEAKQIIEILHVVLHIYTFLAPFVSHLKTTRYHKIRFVH